MKGARVTARRAARAVAKGRMPKADGCGAAHKVSMFLVAPGWRGSGGASSPEGRKARRGLCGSYRDRREKHRSATNHLAPSAMTITGLNARGECSNIEHKKKSAG